jgi:integrase/recombinase XerC
MIHLDAIGSFLEHLSVVRNFSDHTIRNYEMDLLSYYEFSNGEFSKEVIRQYLAFLHEKNISKKTVARRLSALRSIVKYLICNKIIKNNPLLEIKNPKLEKKLPSFLTTEQVIQFFNTPDLTTYLGVRDRTIMELLYATGIRVSELCSLDKQNIDLKEGMMVVLGKGGKERKLPLTKAAMYWIEFNLNHPGRDEVDKKALFLNRFGTRLTTRSVDRAFVEYKHRSSIAACLTPHTLRHTIATHFLDNGMDLKTIQEILGHSNLATTTIYTKVSTRLKRETYEKTHPFNLNN